MNKFYIALIVAGLLIFALWGAGFYPIMKVNSEYVSAAKFRKQLSAARTMEASLKKKDPSFPLGLDIETKVLNGILENKLIEAELERSVNKDVLEALLNEKMDLLSAGDFEKFAREEYGLQSEIAKSSIVLPRIREDILKSRMILDAKDYPAWLSEAKKSARVTLFSLSFRWSGEEILKD